MIVIFLKLLILIVVELADDFELDDLSLVRPLVDVLLVSGIICVAGFQSYACYGTLSCLTIRLSCPHAFS